MKHAVLQRNETSDQGTFGVITVEGKRWFTGELPWRDNSNMYSCVPAGTYKAIFTMSPRFKRRLYLVGPVENRTGIRVHPANLVGDSKLGFKAQMHGCIAIGEKLGWIGKQKAILVSSPAVRLFEKLMGGKPFTLEIKDEPSRSS